MADQTPYRHADSWYVGTNMPRHFMIYIGGFDRYTRRCEEQIEAGYEGFVLGS